MGAASTNYFAPAFVVEETHTSARPTQEVAALASSRDAVVTAAPAGQASIMAVFERLARDPQVDVGKLERLITLQEKILAVNAKAAFEAAFVAMAPELPVVDKRGRIVVPGRDGQQSRSTAYAKREDIVAAVRPILRQHGFAVRHRTEFPPLAPEGKIRIVTVLVHEGGHQEGTEFVAAHDESGAKNKIQAQGSTVSYGERYNTIALLNIEIRGVDDDGKAAGATTDAAPRPAQRKSEQNTPHPRKPGTGAVEPKPVSGVEAASETGASPGAAPNVGVVVGLHEREGGVVVGQLDTGLVFGTRDAALAKAVRDLFASKRRVELVVEAPRAGAQVGKLTEILPGRADA